VVGLTFAVGALLALMASGTPYLRDVMSGSPDATAEFLDDLLWMSIWFTAWVPIVPMIYLLAIRLNQSRLSVGKIVGAYLIGFAFAYVFHVGVQVAAMLLPTYQDVHANMTEAVIHHFLTGVYMIAITYGGVAAVSHAFAASRRSREAELRKIRLESELVQARLQALRNQLHPHFLFNALNSVSALMYRDVAAADEMLAGVGELLRVLIKDSDRHLITLKEELDFMSMYVNVEKIRYGNRLDIVVKHHEELDSARVPALLLQPIVENAIKHGVSKVSGRGSIEISTSTKGDHLLLGVADNGPGFAHDTETKDTGVGISNLKARLYELYGDDQSVSIVSHSQGRGAEVWIEVPLQLTATMREEATAS